MPLPEELFSQKTGSDNGKFLSVGEQTRINIARALLSDASVLIFDELTEGLDPSTASKKSSRKPTRFFIFHRDRIHFVYYLPSIFRMPFLS